MNNPTEKQLDAIIKLMNMDEFMVFVDWIKTSKEEMADQSVTIATEPQRSWMQGRVQELRQLLFIFRDSKDSLANIQKNRGGFV